MRIGRIIYYTAHFPYIVGIAIGIAIAIGIESYPRFLLTAYCLLSFPPPRPLYLTADYADWADYSLVPTPYSPQITAKTASRAGGTPFSQDRKYFRAISVRPGFSARKVQN